MVWKRHGKLHRSTWMKRDANCKCSARNKWHNVGILMIVAYLYARALATIILSRHETAPSPKSSVSVRRFSVQVTIPSSDSGTFAPDPQEEDQIKRNPTTHCLNRRSKAKATGPVESQPVAAAKQSETTCFWFVIGRVLIMCRKRAKEPWKTKKR